MTTASASSTADSSSSGSTESDGSLTLLTNAVERFSSGVTHLQQQSQLAQKRLELEFASIDRCVDSHQSQLKEYQKLVNMMEEVEKEHGAQHPSLTSLRLQLRLAKCSLDQLRDTRPRTDHGLFMRLMLGKVGMTLWKQADRVHFKDEYNKFKARTTLIYILWPLIQLVLLYGVSPSSSLHSAAPFILQLHQLWLLYYYTTLSLRENILLANGSAIMHWWIYHHYLSMLIALVMLLWPNAYLIQQRMAQMLAFGLIQGLVMLFQNSYQKKRLYVRKTLGKAKAIDVDSSETLVEKPTDLSILIPMLFAIYLVELYFGLEFVQDFRVARTKMETPWAVLVMGLAFIVLALGNGYTTGLVLLRQKQKRQIKQAILFGKKKNQHGKDDEEGRGWSCQCLIQ